MATPILILNGPNLNMLGTRQPEIYGYETLADVAAACTDLGKTLGLEVNCAQYNGEGDMVTAIQDARQTHRGIVINAGAYTHTSVAIFDALNLFDGPVIEVHISNVHKREPFRHHSLISARADGIIVGCGTQGYLLALHRLAQSLG